MFGHPERVNRSSCGRTSLRCRRELSARCAAAAPGSRVDDLLIQIFYTGYTSVECDSWIKCLGLINGELNLRKIQDHVNFVIFKKWASSKINLISI